MRALTAAMQAAISAKQIHPAIFVQLTFTNETIYLWSGVGAKSWNGQTWQGVGTLGKIEPISESADIVATGLKLTLSSIPQEYLTDVLSYVNQTCPVVIWLALLDANGMVISSPYESWGGYMDAPVLYEGVDAATVIINVESELLDLQRQQERRYTHEDQQIDFPGDLGFEYVASIQEWDGTGLPTSPRFAATPVSPPAGSGPGAGYGPGGGGPGGGRGSQPGG